MVFGEIIEPTTRALIDDEFVEYPQYVKPDLDWQNSGNVPTDLSTLIFIEGSKIIKLFSAFVVNTQTHCTLSTGEVEIFRAAGGAYVVSHVKKDLATGEIIEELNQWLKKASCIYTIITDSLSNYQNVDLVERPETLIRKLSTGNLTHNFDYQKLESPNLVSGLGPDVLSFSLHTGLTCTSFVVYMDNSPFDSINVGPVLQLMKSLGLSVTAPTSNLNAVPSNLYL